MKHLLLVTLVVLFPLTASAAPTGWRCPDTYYGDGWCDCGCGVIDSDCASSTTPLYNNCQNGFSCGRSDVTCYTGGVRAYRTPAFGGDTFDHTYPCRVENSTVKASYCELGNVYGACPATSEDCPTSWLGDGWCDPPCMLKYGHDSANGKNDCALPEPTQFKCIGIYASSSQSAQDGGARLGNAMYTYDPWFAMGTRDWTLATMKSKFEYVAYEYGECEIWYLIDGVCHQQTNRDLWFSHTAPYTSQWSVKGSSLSEGTYGIYGGSWSDCRAEIGAN